MHTLVQPKKLASIKSFLEEKDLRNELNKALDNVQEQLHDI